MFLPSRTLLLTALFFLSVSSLHAQTIADPTGHWEGAIHAPFGEVNVAIDIAKNGEGEFTATYSNEQGISGLPLSHVAVEGPSITFQLGITSGDRRFRGALSADGQSISGEYFQSVYSVPFDLTRKGNARTETPPKNAERKVPFVVVGPTVPR